MDEALGWETTLTPVEEARLREKDLKRDRELLRRGYVVLRFTYDDVMNGDFTREVPVSVTALRDLVPNTGMEEAHATVKQRGFWYQAVRASDDKLWPWCASNARVLGKRAYEPITEEDIAAVPELKRVR